MSIPGIMAFANQVSMDNLVQAKISKTHSLKPEKNY
jgi:hypothetical protein